MKSKAIIPPGAAHPDNWFMRELDFLGGYIVWFDTEDRTYNIINPANGRIVDYFDQCDAYAIAELKRRRRRAESTTSRQRMKEVRRKNVEKQEKLSNLAHEMIAEGWMKIYNFGRRRYFT